MSARHYKSPEEALIFSIFYDKIDIQEILSYFDLVDKFMRKYDLPMVYWIGDTVAANVNKQTLLDAVNATLEGRPGSGGDARVIPLIIMEKKVATYFMDEFRNRYHWAQFPIFTSAFEAYSFVKFINGR